MNRPTPLSLTLALAIAATLGTAQAAPPAPAPAADSGKLEDVVVTAQRREESAQSVGIALSVLTIDTLEDAGVTKVNDLQNATPSLEVEPAFGSGQAQFRLRGVGFIDYTSNNSSSVAINLDGVAMPYPIQTQGQLFDVARVEVLRGPQGTLYGRNTTGGAVNFISNRPTEELSAGAELNYGSHEAVDFEGFLSGGLGGGVRARLSVAGAEGGAWQRNRDTGEKLGDRDRIAARLQFEWDANSRTNLRLTLHASNDKSDTQGLQLIADRNLGPPSPTLTADTSPYATGWSLRPGFASAIGVDPGSKPSLNNQNVGAVLDLNVDLGGAKLTSITSYNKLIRRELGDWDASQYQESDIYFHDHLSVLSEEARVASTGSGPTNWVAGLYYSDEKLKEQFYGDFYQRLGGAALTQYEQDGKVTGLFGQGDLKFTDQLKGILGLRFEHEKRDLENLVTLFSVSDPVDYSAAFNLSGGGLNRSLSNSDVSGKLGLEYQWLPKTLLYATLSRGVKSGGFTAHNTLNQAAVDPFQPEKLTALEVGVKSDISSQLRLNASAFHYEYRDQQILSKVHDAVSNSDIGRFINAPKSRIDGAEVELTWRPLDGLEISQYAGYKVGKFTDTILNSANVDFNGRDIDFPKLSYGGEIAYTIPLGNLRLRSEVNYSYHDTYSQLFLLETWDPTSKQLQTPLQFSIDSYWLANASVTLLPAASKAWEVSLYCRNLTDQKYFLTKNYFLPATNVGLAGEPTTFGLRLRFGF
ncbi:MAG: TonB-dependent receptor [Proteobacteria bacterium]|nr:TonB-dependent receptor [Pseudomonadota bacterium]